MNQCPCCSGKSYLNCCGRYIDTTLAPTSPEELMRSRYTAYSQANIGYIQKTMKSPAADNYDFENAKEWAESVNWLKLEIVKTSIKKNVGFVEFIAYFSHNNKIQTFHELSEFHFINGEWFYVDGKSLQLDGTSTRIGRNDPCPCNSGKKYKKCCGNSSIKSSQGVVSSDHTDCSCHSH